jgi:DNA-binding GntR family transcriptional regulator
VESTRIRNTEREVEELSVLGLARKEGSSVVGIGQRTRSEQVYGALLKMIAQRRQMPGDRLVVEELAALFGISRTPI